METKTKILIGVLIVGVILIGGWRVWNRYFRPVGISGTPLLPKIPIAPVRLTTDKTEYEQGEKMKIIINNNRNNRIYLLLEQDIYAEPIKIGIEKYENGSWASPLPPFALFSKNQKCGPFGQGPRGGCEKIEPQEKLEIEKSLYYSKCVDGQPKQFSFPPGRYRLKIGIGEKCWAGTGKEAPNIIYSNEFTIK